MPRAPRLDTTIELLKTEQQRARSKIQAAVIIARLGRIAAGEVKIDPASLAVQIRAAEILLRKALPDLSAVDVEQHGDSTITITINKVA